MQTQYIQYYETPEGFSNIIMASDGQYLTGLWFLNPDRNLSVEGEGKDLPGFDSVKRWLHIYFQGRDPGYVPEYKLGEISLFRREVYNIMKDIPYGKTMSYGEIAKKIAQQRGIARMSAQAVGGAVGSNPISIILTCHRVIGADGSLTGYGGGLTNKAGLLSLEWIAVH